MAFFDVTPFSDNLAAFMNLSSIFSSTVPYLSAGTLGAVAYGGLTKNLYLLGTLVDANGEWDGMGAIDKGEFFKGVEFGWTSQNTAEMSYLVDNVHVSYWHRDELEETSTEPGQGISFAATRWFGRWGAFLRAGWADSGALLEKSATTGVAAHVTKRDDYHRYRVGAGL